MDIRVTAENPLQHGRTGPLQGNQEHHSFTIRLDTRGRPGKLQAVQGGAVGRLVTLGMHRLLRPETLDGLTPHLSHPPGHQVSILPEYLADFGHVPVHGRAMFATAVYQVHDVCIRDMGNGIGMAHADVEIPVFVHADVFIEEPERFHRLAPNQVVSQRHLAAKHLLEHIALETRRGTPEVRRLAGIVEIVPVQHHFRIDPGGACFAQAQAFLLQLLRQPDVVAGDQ